MAKKILELNKPLIGICAGFNNILKELVEPFATISSFSKDELVESFELENKKFVMGIKWHPELLLEEFIKNCEN